MHSGLRMYYSCLLWAYVFNVHKAISLVPHLQTTIYILLNLNASLEVMSGVDIKWCHVVGKEEQGLFMMGEPLGVFVCVSVCVAMIEFQYEVICLVLMIWNA